MKEEKHCCDNCKYFKPVEKVMKQMHEQLNRIEEVLFDKQTED